MSVHRHGVSKAAAVVHRPQDSREEAKRVRMKHSLRPVLLELLAKIKLAGLRKICGPPTSDSLNKRGRLPSRESKESKGSKD